MKQLIAVLLTLLITFTGTAQTKIALQAGYNHNTAKITTGDFKESTGYVPGFGIGARIKTAFEPPLHFVGVLAYNSRGYTLSPAMGDTSKRETNIHYIDVAPMLSFDINTSSKSHFSITVGPVLGVAFSGKEKITANGITTSSAMQFSNSNNYSFFNVGIHNGISYHFNQLFIEGSYHLGVSSINNNEEVDNTNIKNRGFALTLGYWLK